MNWLWPRKQTLRDIETSIVIRFGRVLHWAAVAFAGVLWLGEFAGIAFGYWSSSQFVVGVVVLAGVVILLLGRGLRYIFANE